MTAEKTQITTRLIADKAVNRDKLDTVSEGLSVIAKIIECLHSGIKINSYSGTDQGTGDVGLTLDFEWLATLKSDEQLQGPVDGYNSIFSTSAPYIPGTLTVFRNGLKCRDFIERSETQIELSEPPKTTGFQDLIEAIYIKKPF